MRATSGAGEATTARKATVAVRPGCLLLAGLLVFAGLLRSRAAEAALPRYFRSVTSSNGTLSLEVAIRELLPPAKQKQWPRLWLVGVIHLGETNYYAALQRFLDRQDVVLFEGIGAKDGHFDLQTNEFSLQDRIAAALGLAFQLKAIDYQRPNFKNSDLDYAALAALFEGGDAAGAVNATPPAVPVTDGKRKQDAGGKATPAAETGTAEDTPAEAVPGDAASEAPSGDAEFNALVQIMEGRGLLGGLARMGVAALAASPRLQATTRIALIEMLGNLPTNLADIGGLPEGMQKLMAGLIEARNQVVLRDVRREIRRRPRPKSIAIFYGAGHMADLEARLRDALGYRPGRVRWLAAVSINPAAAGLSAFEVGLARGMARMQLDALQGRAAPAAADSAPAKNSRSASHAPAEKPPQNAPRRSPR